MKRFFPHLSALLLTGIFASLPFFPLMSELREFSADGESVSTVWSLVPLFQYYDMSMFARHAFQDFVWTTYIVLLIVYHLLLMFVYWLFFKTARRLFKTGQ